jgi:hypothetical protein
MIRPLLKKTKVYITGGLRTARGMVNAIESGACDGIGIGRPLAAEPYLCKGILSGEVTGTIDNHVPLPLNTQASGSQLHQIGRGEERISDWSVESEVKRWIAEHEKDMARKTSILPKVDSSGVSNPPILWRTSQRPLLPVNPVCRPSVTRTSRCSLLTLVTNCVH